MVPRQTEADFPALARLADLIIKATAVACLVVLPLCIYVYGWRPDRYLLNPISPALYYVLPIATVSLLASLKLQVTSRISLAILLTFLVGSVYSVDLFLTLSGDAFDPRMTAAASVGAEFDARDKLQVIADLERHHTSVVPNVNPSNFLTTAADGSRRSQISLESIETLPLGGISNALTVYCNESGQYVVYTSDEHGFNNPTNIWTAPPVTVAAVGDSFTQGSCVPAEKNVLGFIRRQYPSTLNLGMVNNGPLTELATLKEYLPALQPRIVLWFYYEGNDLEDLQREKESPLLTSYLTESFRQGLSTKQHAIDDAVLGYITEARRGREGQSGRWGRPLNTLTSFLKLEHFRERVALSSGGSHKEHPDVAAVLPLFRTILIDAKTLVGSWQGTLYVVYLPEWLRYGYPKAASRHRAAVLAIVRSAGIPLVDLHPVFQTQADPLALFPYRTDGHYDEEGYRLVGKTILSSIAVDNRSGRDPD